MILLNKQPVELNKFSAGELKIKIENVKTEAVNLHLSGLVTSDEIIALQMISDICQYQICKKIELVIDYLPYARQDRVCNLGESLSLRVIAKILASLYLSKITLHDVHNFSVFKNLFKEYSKDKSIIIKHYNSRDLANALIHYKDIKEFKEPFYSIIIPDQGAYINTWKSFFDKYKIKKNRVLCCDENYDADFNDWELEKKPYYFRIFDKYRDPSNSKIVSLKTKREILCVFSDKNIKNINTYKRTLNWVIIDDLIEGGGMSILLANKLLEEGYKNLHLFVTHGLFSNEKNIPILKDKFKTINCYFLYNEKLIDKVNYLNLSK